MSSDYFVLKDVKLYIEYISEVKNLSVNTSSSYNRDLQKLVKYLQLINITDYSDISDDICSGWIGNLYSLDINPRSIQRHLSSGKGFFRFLKKNHRIFFESDETLKVAKAMI